MRVAPSTHVRTAEHWGICDSQEPREHISKLPSDAKNEARMLTQCSEYLTMTLIG